MARGLFFITGFTAAGALLWAALAFGGRLPAFSSAEVVGMIAIAAYLVTIQAVLNGMVYAGLVALASRGARRSGRRIAAIDVCAGALATFLGWTGLVIGVSWAGFVVPGALSAALAIFAARLAVPR